MTIVWSKKALRKLNATADYIADEFGANRAARFLRDAMKMVATLEQFPENGQVEMLLKGTRYQYRHLVISKQSKLIYRIDKSKVRVVDFWPTKQDPDVLTAGFK